VVSRQEINIAAGDVSMKEEKLKLSQDTVNIVVNLSQGAIWFLRNIKIENSVLMNVL